MSKKIQQTELTVNNDYINSLLNLFDERYKKRVLRYLYRSVRKRTNKMR